MEGDFKRPSRPMDGFTGRQPQPSYRPAAAPQPVAASPPADPEEPAAGFNTAELIARHERETRRKPNRRKLIIAALAVLLAGAGAVSFVKFSAKTQAGPFPSSITPVQITIPVYYPKGLPAGYKVTGFKVVKRDVLNYSVSDPNNDNFYINIQSAPAGFDFTAFDQRFTKPATYTTEIGAATAGLMNNQLICSIQTGKSWVLINSQAVNSTQSMETIAKALKPASL